MTRAGNRYVKNLRMADSREHQRPTPGSPEPDGGEADGLSPEELQAEGGAALPDREAMSLISANVDIPASPEIAADVLAGELDGFGDGAEEEEG